MIIMLIFGAGFGMMAISQASGMAQKMIGVTPAAAAVVVSVLALSFVYRALAKKNG